MTLLCCKCWSSDLRERKKKNEMFMYFKCGRCGYKQNALISDLNENQNLNAFINYEKEGEDGAENKAIEN